MLSDVMTNVSDMITGASNVIMKSSDVCIENKSLNKIESETETTIAITNIAFFKL